MLGTSRILEKGPEYLRKQMEREREATGRVSAAERLAATKINYVRSPQAGSPSSQNPCMGPGSASSLQVSSPSVQNSPTGRPHVSSPSVKDQRSGPSSVGCQQKLNSLIPHETPTSTSPARSMQTVKPPAGKEPGTSPGKTSESNQSKTADRNASNEQEEVNEGNIVKRNSSKKRPDSILLYRQKCELQRGLGNPVRRTLLSSLKEKSTGMKSENKMQLVQIRVFDEDGDDTGEDEDDRLRDGADDDREGGLEHERSRKAVGRSHSDISSRYSKNFGDFDAFFTYCGLEEDVVQSLGRENFSSRSDELDLSYAKIRSVSVATSDGEHSHTSGDIDGHPKEEVKETRQQGSSVIERNARVIKWLYSCRNSRESGKTLRVLD